MFAPLLTQIKNRYYSLDCGMGYLLRMTDGRFVIIDGGLNESGEAEHLYSLLCEQNDTDASPVIAAWFFSHPHEDHIGSFIGFCEKFAQKVRIEKLIYNFPTKEICPAMQDIPEFESAVASLKDAECVTAKREQKFQFAGCVFDVLLTHEDMSVPIPNLNDSSMILRTTLSDHRILWLGDGQELLADRLCELYAEDDLKCDILQVGHHGYGGGSDALHRIVNPETLLWPVPDFTYQWVKDWECNTFLMTADTIKRCFLSGRQEHTFDLSKPLPDSPRIFSPVSGETVYSEDFTDTDFHKLGFCCITGASVEYEPAELSLQKGSCRLTASTAYSVCEFLQPHKLFNVNGYTLSLSCVLEGENAECGLFWENEEPMKRDITRVLWLPLPRQKEVFMQLKADGHNSNAILEFDGQAVQTLPYTPKEQFGLYLVLKNATLTLKKIEVVAQ